MVVMFLRCLKLLSLFTKKILGFFTVTACFSFYLLLYMFVASQKDCWPYCCYLSMRQRSMSLASGFILVWPSASFFFHCFLWFVLLGCQRYITLWCRYVLIFHGHVHSFVHSIFHGLCVLGGSNRNVFFVWYSWWWEWSPICKYGLMIFIGLRHLH